MGLFRGRKVDEEPTSIDQVLANAEHDVEAGEQSVKEAKARIKEEQKQAALDEKDLRTKKQQTAAAQRFGYLAAHPDKALRKVKRDKATRRLAVGGIAVAAISLTMQFSDLDEKATQSLTDKYNSFMSLINGLTETSANDLGTTHTTTSANSGDNLGMITPRARPKDFARIVERAKIQEAVDTAIAGVAPTGPGGS